MLVEFWGHEEKDVKQASFATLKKIAQSSEELYSVVYKVSISLSDIPLY